MKGELGLGTILSVVFGLVGLSIMAGQIPGAIDSLTNAFQALGPIGSGLVILSALVIAFGLVRYIGNLFGFEIKI